VSVAGTAAAGLLKATPAVSSDIASVVKSVLCDNVSAPVAKRGLANYLKEGIVILCKTCGVGKTEIALVASLGIGYYVYKTYRTPKPVRPLNTKFLARALNVYKPAPKRDGTGHPELAAERRFVEKTVIDYLISNNFRVREAGASATRNLDSDPCFHHKCFPILTSHDEYRRGRLVGWWFGECSKTFGNCDVTVDATVITDVDYYLSNDMLIKELRKVDHLFIITQNVSMGVNDLSGEGRTIATAQHLRTTVKDGPVYDHERILFRDEGVLKGKDYSGGVLYRTVTKVNNYRVLYAVRVNKTEDKPTELCVSLCSDQRVPIHENGCKSSGRFV
jgi:hypothetical protein